MQTMVAPIEEDLPTMTMPDCCLEPVYNWNFMCLPRKKRLKIILYVDSLVLPRLPFHTSLPFISTVSYKNKKDETEKTFKVWIFKEVTSLRMHL